MGCLFLLGTSAAQESKKSTKWDQLDALIEAKAFRIESSWARAQANSSVHAINSGELQRLGNSGNRFNLVGNFNFLEMREDSVAAYLPYFGERQFGNTPYADNTAIEFDGVPRELSIEKNEKKKRYELRFVIDEENETFQVHIQFYRNMKSQITINSNQRFIIRYEGSLSAVTEKEEASR